ncbi:Repeat domain-containing protein [Micromonospora haikouensis]|uniref:Repeat domain-containing protein n=2 Tax=Micromonospora haikouensis TaxID=686309 RepID=A0A1C4YLX0_9ACTN|nr:Repeat domain-containing protein [Micromonospora haikouensis]
MRLGCARDAGSYRSLASNDSDLVVALDFGIAQRPEQWQQMMQQVVDTTRADQARGLSLSQSFTLQAQKNSPGFYQTQADGIRYGGSIQAVGSSLVIVVPAADIGTAGFWDGFWKKFVVGLAVTITLVLVGAICLAAFNVGAPEAAPICGAVAGGFSGGVGELVSAALDGKKITGEVWGAAVSTAIWGAVGGGLGGKLVQWAGAETASLVTRLQQTLRRYAAKLGNWGHPLDAVANLINSAVVRSIVETLQRLQRGVGAADVPLRVMPMGDSITYGVGSSTGAGYRVGLYSDLTAQGGRIEFVGSQRSGPAPNAHQGHSGWLIGDIAGIADSMLNTYRPNVVLLHIGTNDMHNNVDPAGAPGRLGSLIDQIFRTLPQVTLLVSTIVPSSNPATQARIAAFNQAVPGLVATRQADGKHVYLVNMSAVTTADLVDELHPKDAGYRKMSAAFYRGVLTTVDAGWIVAPGGISPTAAPVRAWYSQGVVAPGTMTSDLYPGSVSLGSAYKILFGDVNGDGRDDYLVSHSDGSVHVWVNGGFGLDGAIAWIGHGSSGFPYAPGFLWQMADMDVDGRADLLQINAEDGSMVLYINGGTDSQGRYIWYSQGEIAAGVGSPGHQVRVADINGDRRPDYLDVAPDSSVRAWLSGGRGAGIWNWFPQGEIAAGVGSPGSRIRFADINGDGTADYLDVAPDSSVRAWLNGVQPTEWPALVTDIPWFPQGEIAAGVGSPGSQIQLADLDGDRKADYLDVGANGGVRMWSSLGAATGGGWLWASRGSVTTGNSARVVFADLNGDRRADYLEISADSSVRAWLNGGSQGGGWAWNFVGTVATGVGVPGSNVRFADLNGDGRADYLAVDADSSVEGWLNAGPASGGGWVWSSQGIVATGVGSPGGQIRFADVNGDGKADYLDVAPNSSVEAWLSVGAASGGGWQWTSVGTVAIGVNAVAGTSVRFAPLYGTARADYIALGDNGTINVWQNGGGTGHGNWLWLNGGKVADGVGTPGNRIQLADISGDGRADYLDVDPANGATRAWTNAS